MKVIVMHWMAMLLGVAIRIDGVPYGASPSRTALTGSGQTSP
jgi:hypothetical protein